MSRRRSTVHRARRMRGRLAALGAALAVAGTGVGIVVGGPAAQAADPADSAVAGGAAEAVAAAPTTVTEVTNGQRQLKVAVTPYQGLAPSGAQITVAGTGFDRSHDLWVAVCQDDGVAPAALLHCVGGAIPDGNSTAGWGVVTDSREPPYPGPVTTHWMGRGSFVLSLQLPAVIGESADCVSAPCRVYTRSSDDDDRTEDVGVPLVFTAPPGQPSSGGASSQQGGQSESESASSAGPASSTQTSTEPSTPAEPTTQTIGPVPTTVTPDSMLQTSVAVGGNQTVVFTGFTPGEKVSVTVYSDPVTLKSVTADPGGNVRISFKVPAKLAPGEHILQAIGSQSGRVGIARFAVGAAATSSTGTSTTGSTTASVTASSVASTSAIASSSVVASSAGAGSAATSAAAPVSSVAGSPTATAHGAATAGGGNGDRLLWLWIVLAALVVVGAAAGVVAMVRSRRDHEDDLPVTTAIATSPAPGWSAAPGAPGATAPPPTHDPGGFGLLSGREHPDGPVLYSGGQWPDAPTSVIGGGAAPTAPDQPAGGPNTQQWRPDFTGPTPAAGSAPATGPTPAHGEPDTPTQPGPPPDPDEPSSGRHHAG